jgi:hypothetical protein
MLEKREQKANMNRRLAPLVERRRAGRNIITTTTCGFVEVSALCFPYDHEGRGEHGRFSSVSRRVS